MNITEEENKISELTAEYEQLKAQLNNQSTNQTYVMLSNNQNNSVNQTNQTNLVAPITGGAIGTQGGNFISELLNFFKRIFR